MAKKMEGGACCSCKCHSAGCWLMSLSLVVLGAVGLWWNASFFQALYWLLLLNGLACLGSKLCKCC